MSTDFNKSIAFQAACDLIINGANQPSGYTEPLLHAYRQKAKLKNLA
jgi:malate synthase